MPPIPGLFGGEKWIMTSRSAFGYGKGCSSTAFMKLNISVFTPTPSANDVTAITVKPGVRTSRRTANPTSRISVSITVMSNVPPSASWLRNDR